MKRQVLKAINNGTYTVVFDTDKAVNPYTIYYSYYVNGRQKKTKIDQYADFYSCLCDLAARIEPGYIHNEG